MADRKIVLTDCGQCPSCDHKGGFGRIAYVPVCRAAKKDLPHTLHVGIGGGAQASRTPGIPDWCPLPFNAIYPAKTAN